MYHWLAFFAFLPGQFLAQENEERDTLRNVHMEEVVISARRQPDQILTMPAAIQKISKVKITSWQPRTTPELLLGQTGVWVQKTNHGGGSPFIRGLTGQQTLLLMDGIRLNNAIYRSGPNQYLNTINPWTLGGIEVLPGHGAVAYGSDAIGGTLALLSKPLELNPSTSWSGEVIAQWASREMEKSLRFESAYTTPRWGVRLGMSGSDFGDLYAGKGIGRLHPSGYQQWAGDAKMVIKLTKNQQLTLVHQQLQQYGVPIYHKVSLENFALSQFDPQNRQLSYGRWSCTPNGPDWFKDFSFTVSRQQLLEGRQNQKNNSNIQVSERDEDITWGLNAQAILSPFSWWNLTTGLDMYADQVNSSRQDLDLVTKSVISKRGLYPDGSSMQHLAWFVLNALHWHRIMFHVGWRYNTYQLKLTEKTLGGIDLHPSAWVGNLGLSIPLVHSFHGYVALSTAFRAPNVDDLGTLGIVDFRYEVPNYDLKPERSFNKEIGFKWSGNLWSGQINAYHHRLYNLIGRIKTDDVQQGYPVYMKENITRGYIYGFEEDMQFRLSKALTLSHLFRYTWGQNISQNEPWRRIPPWFSSLGLDGQYHEVWSYNLSLWLAGRQDRLAQGDREDNRINPSGTPAWQVFNAGMGYRIKRAQIQLSWNNIFNQAYRVHGSGVDGVGSHIRATVRWTW